VVDFSHPKKISATFFGFGGKNCSAQVNIPLEIEVSGIDFFDLQITVEKLDKLRMLLRKVIIQLPLQK
jgi:hypothetical protein